MWLAVHRGLLMSLVETESEQHKMLRRDPRPKIISGSSFDQLSQGETWRVQALTLSQ
jgi:uncharacterized circularly permuted ATP-grasp superfamily protein